MKKIIALLLSLSMLMGILTSCSGAKSSTKIFTNADGVEYIKFGIFEPQTGENGGGGLQEVIGARYANLLYPDITIGDKTYKIELVEVDNKSDKTEAVNAAQKLIGESVVGVIGSYGSGVSIAAGEYFKSGRTPAIGCSCTNPQVTKDNDFYFRTCFLDPFQGTVMANYAKTHGFDKVAVITQIGDDYSKGLGSFFTKACNDLGIEIVSQQEFQTNQQDFKSILTNIKSANPNFIFAPSSITTAPLILQQARELGINCVMAGGDTWENGTIIKNAHGSAEGMVVTTFYDENSNPTEEGTKFLKGDGVHDSKGFLPYIKAVTGDVSIPAVSALGYDAYLALYKAIEEAQSTDGNKIKNALNSLKYEGVTGEISFNKDGDANKNAAFIKVVENGKFVFKSIQTID